MLIRKFKKCSDEVKLRSFRTFCYNIYGGYLWSSYNSSKDMSKLPRVDSCPRGFTLKEILFEGVVTAEWWKGPTLFSGGAIK